MYLWDYKQNFDSKEFGKSRYVFNLVQITYQAMYISVFEWYFQVQCSIVDPHHYQNLPPNYVEVPKYENAQKIYELECRVFGTAPWYIWLLGTLGILIFLILIGGLTLWWCKKHRSNNQKQWINNGTGKKFNPQQIVMPEPKTYRETELHVIVERAELLTTDL